MPQRRSTALDSKMILQHATCARLPAQAMASLAGLRRAEGISVLLDGDHAWVFWEPGDDQVLRAVLPTSGVVLYEKQGEAWHRAGRQMPSFDVFPDGEPIPLSRAVTPEPCTPRSPRREVPEPSPLRLVRDARPRPTTAATCPMAELLRWVDLATSSQIGAIRGAIQGDTALLLGRALPAWPGSKRYWGGQLLVPIGYEVRPNLPEASIVEALGNPASELLRIVPDEPGVDGGLTVEAIPLEAFRPLTRAGVRLAMVGASLA